MLLAPLNVIEPISTLVTSVRVQGQVPGAHVLVISLFDQQVKASDIATESDQRFKLLPNITLTDKDILVATQTLAGNTSQLSDRLAAAVEQAPQSVSDIGYVKINTDLCEGEDHLWISNCISGAVVEAFFNGKMQGRGIAEEGVVRLRLAAKLQKDAPVSVHQMVKGVGTGPKSRIMPESLPLHCHNIHIADYPLKQSY
ncbi:hypothetical protein [Crenothrix polyspora]|uniref:Uncharacterized protein n=1 Tax=Crenothrix polyspora TaxID=360316 RepID=A0A1R4GZW3_9GAMM|nr:hypothetical protein [Crenothrix polyspora]SJM89505.1 hypothetical protein CRENPOLYSF1_1120011 [Crenothrix polyspora]